MSNVNGVFDVNLTESQTPRGLTETVFTETVFTETGRSQRYPSHARGIGRGSGDAGIPAYTSLGSQTVFKFIGYSSQSQNENCTAFVPRSSGKHRGIPLSPR